jgi:hypothetical protein
VDVQPWNAAVAATTTTATHSECMPPVHSTAQPASNHMAGECAQEAEHPRARLPRGHHAAQCRQRRPSSEHRPQPSLRETPPVHCTRRATVAHVDDAALTSHRTEAWRCAAH